MLRLLNILISKANDQMSKEIFIILEKTPFSYPHFHTAQKQTGCQELKQ